MNMTLIELSDSELTALSSEDPVDQSPLAKAEIPVGGTAVSASVATLAGVVSGGHIVTLGRAGMTALIDGSIFAY